MLLIRLNTILYALNNFKAYVLQVPTAKTNIAFLANNTIAFTLTKKEINNIEKLTRYSSPLLSFNNINYLDELYHNLKRPYPFLQTRKNNTKEVFTHVFKLLQDNKLSNHLSSVILRRGKGNFQVRLLGVLGSIKMSSMFINFIKLWNNNNRFNYNDIVKFMLYWLHTNFIMSTNATFLKLVLKKQSVKIFTKQNKIFNQKKTVQKTLIVFSNEAILCN